jgi:hypothetical protein
LDELKGHAQTYTNDEKNLTDKDKQAVLIVYKQRSEILGQEDMFSPAPVSVDSTIQKIKAATSQDDINAIFADPALESF